VYEWDAKVPADHGAREEIVVKFCGGQAVHVHAPALIAAECKTGTLVYR
jgi:hypothetical protein